MSATCFSVVKFSVASIVGTAKTVLSVSFSVTAALKVSSTMVVIVGMAVLGVSIFLVA